MNKLNEKNNESAFNYEEMVEEAPQCNHELSLYEMNISIQYNQLIENKEFTLIKMMNKFNMSLEDNLIQEE